MKINKLIYVSTPYKSAIDESQVYNLLEYYYDANKFKEVILIQIYSNQTNYFNAQRILKKYHFKKIFIRGKIGLIFPFNTINWKLKKAFSNIITDKNFILHVRTEMLGYYVINALNWNKQPLNVLIDIRGTTVEEIDYRLKYGKENNLYLNIIKSSYRKLPNFYHTNNVAISAVSKALKDYLIKNNFNENIEINPNVVAKNFCFDMSKRINIRKQLNIKDEQVLIVLSSGGGTIWQKDKTIVNFINKRENYIILNLSRTAIKQDGVINMFLPFEKMPDYLSAADVAIVWRDKHILNTCASPSKFSEFAAMGLYVIHNNSVELIVQYLKENEAGILKNEMNEVSIDLSKIQNNKLRQLRAERGRKEFGIEAISKNYYKSYLKILYSM